MTIGVCLPWACSRASLHVAKPSTSGIITSSNMIAGRALSNSAMPLMPPAASAPVMPTPSSVSRTRSRIIASSSMTNAVTCSGAWPTSVMRRDSVGGWWIACEVMMLLSAEGGGELEAAASALRDLLGEGGAHGAMLAVDLAQQFIGPTQCRVARGGLQPLAIVGQATGAEDGAARLERMGGALQLRRGGGGERLFHGFDQFRRVRDVQLDDVMNQARCALA